MHIWHLTPDAPRWPHWVSLGEQVILHIGTWPIEPAQSVYVTYQVEHPLRRDAHHGIQTCVE